MASFEHALIGKAHVIRLKGDFDLPEHAAALSDAVDQYASLDAPCVVVNWAAVRRMNSLGFAELIKLESKIPPGGEVRHCCLSEWWRKAITILYHEYPANYFNTEQEAVDSCGRSTRPEAP